MEQRKQRAVVVPERAAGAALSGADFPPSNRPRILSRIQASYLNPNIIVKKPRPFYGRDSKARNVAAAARKTSAVGQHIQGQATAHPGQGTDE